LNKITNKTFFLGAKNKLSLFAYYILSKNIASLKHLLNVCLDPGFQTLDYRCCCSPLGLQCARTSEGPLSPAVF